MVDICKTYLRRALVEQEFVRSLHHYGLDACFALPDIGDESVSDGEVDSLNWSRSSTSRSTITPTKQAAGKNQERLWISRKKARHWLDALKPFPVLVFLISVTIYGTNYDESLDAIHDLVFGSVAFSDSLIQVLNYRYRILQALSRIKTALYKSIRSHSYGSKLLLPSKRKDTAFQFRYYYNSSFPMPWLFFKHSHPLHTAGFGSTYFIASLGYPDSVPSSRNHTLGSSSLYAFGNLTNGPGAPPPSPTISTCAQFTNH